MNIGIVRLCTWRWNWMQTLPWTFYLCYFKSEKLSIMSQRGDYDASSI